MDKYQQMALRLYRELPYIDFKKISLTDDLGREATGSRLAGIMVANAEIEDKAISRIAAILKEVDENSPEVEPEPQGEPEEAEGDPDHLYPTAEELQRIRSWDPNDLPGLFAYLKDLWHMADWGWSESPEGEYSISTGGWSGNEELVGAFMGNTLAWVFTWQSSTRGGHYRFKVSK